MKHLFRIHTHNYLLAIFSLLVFSAKTSLGLVEGKLGKIDASVTLRGEEDARVVGISSSSFQGAKTSSSALIAANELKSEDDFIIRF